MAGYDEYVEGVEAEETTSLDTPLQEVGKRCNDCGYPFYWMFSYLPSSKLKLLDTRYFCCFVVSTELNCVCYNFAVNSVSDVMFTCM